MMSLVAYASSDEGSDNEETQENGVEEKEQPKVEKKDENEENQDIEEIVPELHTKLPAPRNPGINLEIVEEDDEFLRKKATPVPRNIKKAPVKIMIPSLSDFKELEEKKEDQKVPTVINRKSSLLSMLPKPKSGGYVPPPSIASSSSESSETSSKKSNPLIPYSVMNRKKPTKKESKAKKPQKPDSGSESDEDGESGSFFSFGSGNEKLPEVSLSEINSMVAKKAAKMNEFARKLEKEDQVEEEPAEQMYEQNQEDMDSTAIQALLGGNKAKRTKMDDIKFIDLSGQDVLPDKEDWMRKTLRGETEFIATGNLIEKGPNALAKRKHQISYLAMRAQVNEQELEAMWQSNRQTKREAKSKYGF